MIEFENNLILSKLQTHFSNVLIRRIHWLAVAMLIESEFYVRNQCVIDTNVDSFSFAKDCIWPKACQKWSAFEFATFVLNNYYIGCA